MVDTTEWLEQLPLHITGDPSNFNSNARSGKTWNDLHGSYYLKPALVAFIDTPEFQRLDNLKQLGLTHYVYRDAQHTRFGHSVGVSYLAGKWANLLLSRGYEEGWGSWGKEYIDREWRQKVDMVSIAGLCHDLGHGPFSHVFEYELLPRIVGREEAKAWRHETMSEVILEHMVEENNLDLEVLLGVDSQEGIRFIKSLVAGGPLPSNQEDAWLYDIVANKRNGVDVDKFDYLLRDGKATGNAVNLNVKRIMLLSKVEQGQIAFRSTEYENLHIHLFCERASMHRKVYTHRKAKGVDILVCDALAMAAPELGLTRENLADVEQYLELDDSILVKLKALKPEDSENPKRIEMAQHLLKRLTTRQLYVYIDEVLLNPKSRPNFQPPTPQDLVNLQKSNGTNHFTVHDVVLCDTKINYSMGEENPLDNIIFYQEDGACTIEQDRTSNILPKHFEDYKVRVYSRSRDPAIVEAIRVAFRHWIDAYNDQLGQDRLRLCTPMKPQPGYCARAWRGALPGGLSDGAVAVAAAANGWQKLGKCVNGDMDEDGGSQPPSRKRQRSLAKQFGSIAEGQAEGEQEQ